MTDPDGGRQRTRNQTLQSASSSVQSNPNPVAPFMEISCTVRQILAAKGREVITTNPDASVFDALTIMGAHNIGALVVVENEQVVGVISERDYSRKVVLRNRTSRETRVGEVLSQPAITVTPEDGITKCMELMTVHHVRHLPVLEDGQLIGIVSIGDVVHWVITAQRQAIEQLTGYISGGYPA